MLNVLESVVNFVMFLIYYHKSYMEFYGMD
jgi:hypothetical protein